MCGIAGLWGSEATDRVLAMTRVLAHRGPDDEGVWSSARRSFALGNRRLRILDLSPAGHQPMVSEGGRFVLTFNGEIFNHRELRSDLGSHGHTFRSTSDTEVLLAALMEWGAAALERVHGMFAFGFWDEHRETLLLARDRLGIKPLYVAIQNGEFAFSSEIRSLLVSGIVRPALNKEALESYLRLLWVPEPGTLFRGIRKLEPGTCLQWSGDGERITRYWDVPMPIEGNVPTGEELEATIKESVRRQLQADVPIGAFLSGGIDSTAIVAMCRKAGLDRVRTYSIGFRTKDRESEGAYDDLEYARLAARFYRTEHHEIVLEPNVASLLPRVVRHLEDPVADPAAINCLLISEAARATSTALLAGTGGDELFGGYRKYSSTALTSGYQNIPSPIRSFVLEPLVRGLPVRIGSKGIRLFRFMKKLVRYAGDPLFDRFLGYSSYYDAPELESILGLEPTGDPYRGAHALLDAWQSRGTDDLVDRMTYVDLKFYLPGLNLSYMDKASMAASVEVRVPLLDELLIDAAARIPGRRKVSGTRTKVAFRDALRADLPSEILSRPKAPFSVPIRSWLAGDLSEYSHDLLSPSRVRRRGLLDVGYVQTLMKEHESGREDHSLRIWALLTLEEWMQEFCDSGDRAIEDSVKRLDVPVSDVVTTQ